MKTCVAAILGLLTIGVIGGQGQILNNASELSIDKKYVGCNGKANSKCVSMMKMSGCPSGYYYTYSGCGFLEVCCYPQVQPNTPAPPTESPDSPTKKPVKSLTCGNPSVNEGSRIVGGEMTSIEAFPWQVSLQYNYNHFCGASIISEKWLVTAAHCLVEFDSAHASYINVVAGTRDSQGYYRSNIHTIDKMLTHGGYDTRYKTNDIAMIKLDKPLDLSSTKTRPICLPAKGATFDDVICTATGWGHMSEGSSSTTRYLRRVNLPIHRYAVCRYVLGGIDSSQICAGYTAGGRDTCQGDSGGPLACKQGDGSWVLAGVVSGGRGCAREDQLGFYTQVSYFRDWISAVIERYGD